MATAAQIRTNRVHALRSTGPRTAAGKARSSMNGLKASQLPRIDRPMEIAFRDPDPIVVTRKIFTFLPIGLPRPTTPSGPCAVWTRAGPESIHKISTTEPNCCQTHRFQ